MLKNDDRVTGAVVKKDGNNLIVKTDQFGTVTVAWDQVASIRTNRPVDVVLQPPITVAPSDITTLRDDAEQATFDRLQHPGWGQLWAGTAALGLAGTAGNADARLCAGLSRLFAKRKGEGP